jgi:LemA protein
LFKEPLWQRWLLHLGQTVNTTLLIILGSTLGLVLIALIVLYNRLVKGRLMVSEGYSGIDVQLKRRHNLIPNLVSTVQGYANFERGVLENVTRLRSQLAEDKPLKETAKRENELSSSLKHLFAVAENYPDLKASQSFLELQKQLTDIEDTIQKARRYYNATVRDYNIRVQSFPSLIVAKLFAFKAAEFFQLVTSSESEVPRVEIDG